MARGKALIMNIASLPLTDRSLRQVLEVVHMFNPHSFAAYRRRVFLHKLQELG